jgi:hypothetical protein
VQLWASEGEEQQPISLVVLTPSGLGLISGCADGALQLWARPSPSAEWQPALRMSACQAGVAGGQKYGVEVNCLKLEDPASLWVRRWLLEVAPESKVLTHFTDIHHL